MESLSTPCVFCGVDRPLAADTCPTCGRGWIDARVSDLADAPPSAAARPAKAGDAAAPGANPGHEDEPPAVEDDELAAIAPPSFSDATNTGFDAPESEHVDSSEERRPADEVEPEREPPGDLTSEIAAPAMPESGEELLPKDGPEPDTAAAEFVEPLEKPPEQSEDEPEAAPAEATSMFAAAPPTEPQEASGDEAPEIGAATTPPEGVPPHGSEPEPTASEGEEDEAFATQAPDELGILPVIEASGPPEYLPEPADTPPPPLSADAEGPPPTDESDRSPETPASLPSGGEHPESGGEQPADELGVIPVIEPAAPPPPPAETGPPPAAPTPREEPLPALDPDGLIDEVFSEDLIDGRPPDASDAMLDDADAWSHFAAREPGRPPVSPPPPPPAVPPPVGGAFPGEDPATSAFFTDDPLAIDPAEARAARGGTAEASRRRWSQTAIVAVIVLGIIGVWFVVLAWITGDDDGEPTAGGVDDTSNATAATTAAPDTTAATTSSTSTSTTTTTTTAAPVVIEPSGDAIPIEDLGLGAFALGPLDFGATDALPRLVASLEQPDAISDSSGTNGLCPDDTGFTAQWGPFSAIFIGAPETNVFVGYRLEEDGGHPTTSLTTLSGLQVGDTVETLESTYADFELSYEEIDGVLSFILVRTSDDATLLWGPVTSSEADGVVQGIYSPRPCDDGPSPSS